MKRALLFVSVLACALVLFAPAVAGAANADCIACHAAGGAAFSRVDFGSSVDYARCRACHWPAPADYVGNYRHQHGPDQSRTCASCHLGPFQSLDPARVAAVMTPYGYFNSSASTSMTPATIHAAHVNGSWEQASGLTATDECQSCHKPAACGACHTAPAAHADHTLNASSGAYAYPAVTVEVGGGTPEGVRYVRNVFTVQQTCTNAACHEPAKVAAADFVPACVTCHPTRAAAHGYDPVQHTSSWSMAGCVAAGCHTSNVLLDEHLARNATYTCATCHSSANPAVVAAIAAKDTACGSCHPGISATQGHRDQHQARPSLTNADGTGNYAYYTGTLSGAKTSDCAMCHASNIVDAHLGVSNGATSIPAQKDSSGAPLTCATCHASVAPAVIAAIANHVTACDACHTVHGPIGAVHTSTFVDAPAVPCAACHAKRLDDAHALASATTPSGVVLNGCALCHGYFEGARGARVQSAISTSNDTRCSACHDAIHADTSAAHTTTATAIGAMQCGDCHDTAGAGVSVTTVHAGATLGACKVCHENSARVPDITAKTPACTSCHTVAAIHAAAPAKHSSTSTECAGAGCHAIADVTALHAAASTTVAGASYTACRVCHRPGLTLTTSACSNCHPGHGDLTAKHTATVSSGCVACHETGDVRAVHTKLGCGACHANPARIGDIRTRTAECVSCHAGLNPADPNHYAAASHAASESATCGTCHYLDVKAEHFKASSGPVSCVTCHETKVDAFTSAWAKTCAACHPTKHTLMSTKHASTTTACSGAACHNTADVADVHKRATGGGCPACHTSRDSLPTTTACAACHPSVTGNHHASHDTSVAIDPGCDGCHFRYLDDEHAKLGYACATCHSSSNAAVVAAIAGHDRSCDACHPAVNGKDRHASQNATEFVPAATGGHRAYSSMAGQRSTFAVNGATYTWGLPSASSFLKSGWTNTSVVTCDSCHTFSGAAGPHGSAVAVNIDPAYSSSWRNACLGDSGTGYICAKCHTNITNANRVHSTGDHRGSGGKCVLCHPSTPHAWRLPRMLAYTTDPAPYRSTGLKGIKLRSYSSPNDWGTSDCGSTCGEHDTTPSPLWPATLQVTGSISGTVKDGAGLPVAVATVTLDNGASTVTDSSGRYSFGSLPPGSATVSAAKTGYTGASKTVTVIGNQTVTADVTITLAPVNYALNKAFTASHYESYSYVPSKAGDGSTSTWWWSNHSGYASSSEWLKVDLGTAQTIDTVEIAWYDGCWAKDYRIYVSTDNTNWTQVYSTSYATSGGVKTHTFTAKSARYVRVDCRATSGSNTGYAIAELRVFQ